MPKVQSTDVLEGECLLELAAQAQLLEGERDLNCLRDWGGKASSATGDRIERARAKKNKGASTGIS